MFHANSMWQCHRVLYIRNREILLNPLWKRHVCPKLINLIMENKQSHKSGVSSTLYNVSMKGLLLSPIFFIWTYPFCFSVTKLPSATSRYLSIYTSEPGTKSQISGVMWQVTPDSKIKLVSYEMSPKYLLGIHTLEEICVIGVFILCDSFCSVLLSNFINFSDFYA